MVVGLILERDGCVISTQIQQQKWECLLLELSDTYRRFVRGLLDLWRDKTAILSST